MFNKYSENIKKRILLLILSMMSFPLFITITPNSVSNLKKFKDDENIKSQRPFNLRDSSGGERIKKAQDKCYHLRHYFMKESFELINEIPEKPFTGQKSEYCSLPNQVKSVNTCCSPFIEKILAAKQIIKLENGIKENLDGINREFYNASIALRRSVLKSIVRSGLNLNSVFNKTYGIIYAQNSDLFYDFFALLTRYIQQESSDRKRLDNNDKRKYSPEFHSSPKLLTYLNDDKRYSLTPELITDFFFVELYVRTFTLINAQYNLTEKKFNSCLRSTYNVIRPFSSTSTSSSSDITDMDNNNPLYRGSSFNSSPLSELNGEGPESYVPGNDLARDVAILVSRSLNAARALMYGLEELAIDLKATADPLSGYERKPPLTDKELIFNFGKAYLAYEPIRAGLMRSWGCPLCNPDERYLKEGQEDEDNPNPNTIPCPDHCLKILQIAIQPLVKLSEPWKKFIDGALLLIKKLQGSFNIKNNIETLDVKISECIMNFQENSHKFSSEVFGICGQPALKNYGNNFDSTIITNKNSWKTRSGNDGNNWSKLSSIVIVSEDNNSSNVIQRTNDLLDNAKPFWEDMFQSLKIKLCPVFVTSVKGLNDSREGCLNGTTEHIMNMKSIDFLPFYEKDLIKINAKWDRLSRNIYAAIRGSSIYIPDDEDQNPAPKVAKKKSVSDKIEMNDLESSGSGFSPQTPSTMRNPSHILKDSEDISTSLEGGSGQQAETEIDIIIDDKPSIPTRVNKKPVSSRPHQTPKVREKYHKPTEIPKTDPSEKPSIDDVPNTILISRSNLRHTINETVNLENIKNQSRFSNQNKSPNGIFSFGFTVFMLGVILVP